MRINELPDSEKSVPPLKSKSPREGMVERGEKERSEVKRGVITTRVERSDPLDLVSKRQGLIGHLFLQGGGL